MPVSLLRVRLANGHVVMSTNPSPRAHARRAPDLRFRIGCPLALLLTALLAGAANYLLFRRPISAGDRFDLIILIGFIGLPFAALAVARTRDVLAWLFAIALTAGIWVLAFSPLWEGVEYSVGFFMWFTPPAIAGACLAIAGMRGRIPWAIEDADGAERDQSNRGDPT